MSRPSVDLSLESAVEPTVGSIGYHWLALASLRTGMVLMALAAGTDCLFALVSGPTPATAVEGLALTSLGVGGLLRPDIAAWALTPRARVTGLAAAFAVIGAVDLGFQNHYGEVLSAVMFVAALVSSARWVALCLAVSALGYLGDRAIHGYSLHEMFAAGQSTVATQLVDLILNAVCGLALILLLRRFTTRVPATLAAARGDGGAAAPALRRAVAASLARADPCSLVEHLTRAERDVLRSLAAGRAPKQAAHDRGVAIATIRSHIAAAKRKTGARTLEQLIALFAEAEIAR